LIIWPTFARVEFDAQLNQMEKGRWWTAAPRAIVQRSLAIYIAKCIVWDMGLGTTPDIKSALIASAFNLIIVMWFGGKTLEKISSTVVSRIGRSRWAFRCCCSTVAPATAQPEPKLPPGITCVDVRSTWNIKRVRGDSLGRRSRDSRHADGISQPHSQAPTRIEPTSSWLTARARPDHP
jgi:hypothetical protein